MTAFRCRTVAATNSITAIPASTPRSYQPKCRNPGHLHPGLATSVSASGFDHAGRRSVIRVNSDGRPSRSAKPGHSPVQLFT